MTTSIQVVRGKVKMLNDHDLMALVCLIDLELANNEQRYSGLSAQAAIWKRCVELSGPGTIDLELEKLTPDSEMATQFVAMLCDIEVRLKSYQQVVPADLLQARLPSSVIKFANYPVDRLLATVNEIRELIGP